MEENKIIQISCCASGEYPETMYALTEKGDTFLLNTGNSKWTALPPIPDDLCYETN